MKKFLLLSAIALLPVLCWASWAPSVSAFVSYHGAEIDSGYDSSGSIRSSASAFCEVNLLAITIGCHRVSLPLSAGYIGESQQVGRTFVQERVEGTCSLEYGLRILKRFSLSLSLDLRCSWFPDSASSLWRLGATLKPQVRLAEHISIIAPVALAYDRTELAFLAGLGAQASFGGWK